MFVAPALYSANAAPYGFVFLTVILSWWNRVRFLLALPPSWDFWWGSSAGVGR